MTIMMIAKYDKNPVKYELMPRYVSEIGLEMCLSRRSCHRWNCHQKLTKDPPKHTTYCFLGGVYEFITIWFALFCLTSHKKCQDTEAFIIKSSSKNIFISCVPPAFALKFVSHTNTQNYNKWETCKNHSAVMKLTSVKK